MLAPRSRGNRTEPGPFTAGRRSSANRRFDARRSSIIVRQPHGGLILQIPFMVGRRLGEERLIDMRSRLIHDRHPLTNTANRCKLAA
jgi:hypothetical protein